MTVRMAPAARREAIIDATLAVMVRRGLAATTVRDVAEEMGVSPGLVHHYFDSMDDLLATAFERAAEDGLAQTRAAMSTVDDAVEKLSAFFASYTRAEQDWAFQLWLDAWAEAARRPAVRATSYRLNVAWQQVLVEVIDEGVASGAFTCRDSDGSAWRILSLLDGLALQTVAHQVAIDRESVVAWSTAYAENELGYGAS
jgi:AcrR family transcriptional regulator